MSLERNEIVGALHDAQGKIGVAARRLGASRRTLQKRMRDYKLPRGRAGRPRHRLSRKRKRIAAGIAVAAAIALGIYIAKK